MALFISIILAFLNFPLFLVLLLLYWSLLSKSFEYSCYIKFVGLIFMLIISPNLFIIVGAIVVAVKFIKS